MATVTVGRPMSRPFESPHTIMAGGGGTEFLPFVTIQIPCLPIATQSITQPPLTHPSIDPTRPRLLPWPILLVLTIFFVTLTGLGIGTNGINHISQHVIGTEIIPESIWASSSFSASSSDPSHLHTLSSIERQQAEQRAQYQRDQNRVRAERRQRMLEREGQNQSIFDYLTLVSLPPLEADAFHFLVAYEYTSLFIFLFRQFICRPVWYAFLWWHLICMVITIYDLIKWRWKQGIRQTTNQSTQEQVELLSPSKVLDEADDDDVFEQFDSDAGGIDAVPLVPPLPTLLLHIFFWSLNSLIWGWPSIFLMRHQLRTKTKKR